MDTTNGTVPTTYNEWIEQEQKKRNSEWQKNVLTEKAVDTEKPPKFD